MYIHPQMQRSQPLPIPIKSSNTFNPSNNSPTNKFISQLERRYKQYYNNMSPVLILSSK